MLKANVVQWLQSRSPDYLEFEESLEWAVTHLKTLLQDEYDPERTGIYVVTQTVGIEASINLWKHTLEQGARFASAQSFPWTLPSSFATHIAAHLDIRGPNYTLVGQKNNAAFGAFQQTLYDMHIQCIDQALVCNVELLEHVKITSLYVTNKNQNTDYPTIQLHSTFNSSNAKKQSAAELFCDIYQNLTENNTLRISHPEEGSLWVESV